MKYLIPSESVVQIVEHLRNYEEIEKITKVIILYLYYQGPFEFSIHFGRKKRKEI